MKALSFSRVVCALLLLTSFLGCSDDITVSDGQEVFFEVNYSNQAWGYQFKGFLIDKDGRVRTYDKPDKWINGLNEASFTAEDLQANLSKTTLSSYLVPAADLSKYIAQAALVNDSDFTKPTQVGADGGATSFYIYRYNPSSKDYKAILLKQIGDVEIFNKDTDAKTIADWLTTLAGEIY
ncbi:hypothetical protein [Dyadobacter pollutisoli]|uniref:Uncharacterized protein n=1 Tax=Dyadobacter pollutisoli TaxID=2910158 RepID=A0A9E8NAC7_9BACT|nr:hypothetical protein [Dyadobacter pollutisoli]WAC12949.1 hypothetical protein ON006_03070 [Dyadobacter pollutisoli]